jgi:hypothetical protein
MRFEKTARRFSLFCCAVLFGLWSGGLIEFAVNVERAEEARAAKAVRERVAGKLLAHVQADDAQREVVCLTNIVYHEARGELPGHRELIATVVLAMRDDPKWPSAKTVCGLAKQKGLFSHLKDPELARFSEKAWMENFLLADSVYRNIWRDQLLPRGWECVRAFAISDEYKDSLGPKARKQLGITPEERGFKFFRAKFDPVDTRGRKTFHTPKGGCAHPMPTT